MEEIIEAPLRRLYKGISIEKKNRGMATSEEERKELLFIRPR
jgi:hypothetical protein